jgi:hypothetical protein
LTRKHFELRGTLEPVQRSPLSRIFASGDAADEDTDRYPVAMLVGDGTYNGLFVPTKELRKAAVSMDRQPLNLDHSYLVADEIGYVIEPKMKAAALKGLLILNPETANYATAKGYIKNRFAAGKPPEVSVGFWCDVLDEEDEKGDRRYVAQNIEFDHLALVTRGACSPADGAGVGLSSKEPAPIEAAAKVEDVKPTPPTEAEAVLRAELEKSKSEAAALTQERDALKVERDALAKERDTLAQREVALTAKLADERPRLKLAAECESLGLAVSEADTTATLTARLADVKAALAKAPKAEAAPQRHTAPNTQGADSKSALRNIVAHMGFDPSPLGE